MFKKILVAFDGSENAFKALRKAIGLAKQSDGEIGLATVVNLPGLPSAEPIKRDHLSGKRTPFQRQLEKAALLVMQEELPVTTHLLRGQAPRSLVTFCEINNYDVVVTGARGTNPLKHAETGSFTTYLVSNLPCPVMVVKENEDAIVRTA